MISMRLLACERMLSRHSFRYGATLYTGITMLINGVLFIVNTAFDVTEGMLTIG